MGDDRPGYYSAADICGIIEEACRLALEEIQASGKTEPIPLTKEMFVKAFKKTPPSISQELLDEYNNFRSNIND
jgi:SpoVK/Ycf46/Vps4 family AAA+-type ATPase